MSLRVHPEGMAAINPGSRNAPGVKIANDVPTP
jgi:hypothetical protein